MHATTPETSAPGLRRARYSFPSVGFSLRLEQAGIRGWDAVYDPHGGAHGHWLNATHWMVSSRREFKDLISLTDIALPDRSGIGQSACSRHPRAPGVSMRRRAELKHATGIGLK